MYPMHIRKDPVFSSLQTEPEAPRARNLVYEVPLSVSSALYSCSFPSSRRPLIYMVPRAIGCSTTACRQRTRFAVSPLVCRGVVYPGSSQEEDFRRTILEQSGTNLSTRSQLTCLPLLLRVNRLSFVSSLTFQTPQLFIFLSIERSVANSMAILHSFVADVSVPSQCCSHGIVCLVFKPSLTISQHVSISTVKHRSHN
ncbi:hypothetical protein Tco_0909984 [Tanacetum coccineum]|uniref:Uncharacterized protein n=1 Tax=Tanacetum coccineum TaxID=301880 RepID=A0ABQ5CYQ6_9ASTR